MEKIVRKKLVEHLERKNFVTQHQLGFRDGKSCITGLIEFYDLVTKIRQEGEGLGILHILDCQKAFDTVPHKRLVQKAGDGIESFFYLFADDAQIMRRIKTEEDSMRLQDDLYRLNDWSNKWLQKFNPSKGKVMKLCGRNTRPDTEYRKGDEVLHEMDREKDLGVDIMPNLSPEAHIKKNCGICNVG
ncbi:uncharacterized protein [Procambarus clarkii]|uniref:uncharacterized protein n=1 Tax=Procambarus clarkii TaxID=6728 RepID=UPI003742B7B2